METIVTLLIYIFVIFYTLLIVFYANSLYSPVTRSRRASVESPVASPVRKTRTRKTKNIAENGKYRIFLKNSSSNIFFADCSE